MRAVLLNQPASGTSDPPAAILLVAHGSRQPHAEAVAGLLRDRLADRLPKSRVEVGYLERNEPSPYAALLALRADGATEIRVVPLLFGPGYHYRVDLPESIRTATDEAPELQVELADPLSAEDAADLLLDSLDVRLAELGRDEAADALVLIAAGSSDPAARGRITDLAQRWSDRRQVPVEVAFASLTGAEVTNAVNTLRANGSRRIEAGALMVAGGRLYDAAVRASVAAGAGLVAAPLGDAPPFVELLVRRSTAAQRAQH